MIEIYIAAVPAVLSLWACWAISDKVVAILESLDIRGDGVGIVWFFICSPLIMTGVYKVAYDWLTVY